MLNFFKNLQCLQFFQKRNIPTFCHMVQENKHVLKMFANEFCANRPQMLRKILQKLKFVVTLIPSRPDFWGCHWLWSYWGCSRRYSSTTLALQLYRYWTKIRDSRGLHVSLAKVGGPQIRSANRKFADLNFCLDMRTFRKCSNLRICDLWAQVFFADLELQQIHNFSPFNTSLNCFRSNSRRLLEFLCLNYTYFTWGKRY